MLCLVFGNTHVQYSEFTFDRTGCALVLGYLSEVSRYLLAWQHRGQHSAELLSDKPRYESFRLDDISVNRVSSDMGVKS